jgi:hypothetical protein
MSFEGYYQILCKNGHLDTPDVYLVAEPWKCPDCGAEKAWSNMVNLTNGSYSSDDETTRIDGYVELVQNTTTFCTCTHCGNTHPTAPTTYRIPKA